MSLLSSKQVTMATGLINQLGFKLKEYNDKSVLKLKKGNTIIYLYPPKNK